MEKIRKTPSQTVGPFFAYGLTAVQYGYDFTSIASGVLVGDNTDGERINIRGRIFDGKGETISDAMIELWQPDVAGFGRLGTGTTIDRSFNFQTIKPGKSKQWAPHINVILFMRGSLRHLYTRIYFPDEDNEKDPVFSIIEKSRRDTLLASKHVVNGSIEYHFDIYMQGEKETVFFDI